MIGELALLMSQRLKLGALGQVIHHLTDQLVNMGLFYDVATTLVSNHLVNVPSQNPPANIHEWDWKP
jgi:hypothetical protein